MPRLAWLLALAATACSAPEPPPPSGLIPADLVALEGPVAAVRERMEAMRPLLAQVDEADETSGPARAALEGLAREVAWILSREDLPGSPLEAARLRARVLFVTDGTTAERGRALDAAFTVLERVELGAAGS